MTRADLDSAEKFVTRAALRLRGVKVTALVGPSGSGKSFRARLVAERRGIEVIVDDGLIVVNGSVFAGHWAKKEGTLMAATRCAIFADPEAAVEARRALRDAAFRHALVVATSMRMACKIADNICLPRPSEVISIEAIATRQEINSALRHRSRSQSHSPPFIQVGVRRNLAARILGLARRYRALGPTPTKVRITSPDGDGSISFSEAALIQMTCHCAAEVAPTVQVRRVAVTEISGMVDLHVALAVPFAASDASRLHELRETIMHGIERYAGVMVRKVEIVVEEVMGPGIAGAAASGFSRRSGRCPR